MVSSNFQRFQGVQLFFMGGGLTFSRESKLLSPIETHSPTNRLSICGFPWKSSGTPHPLWIRACPMLRGVLSFFQHT